MATEHVFKVTLQGYADAQVREWVANMGRMAGILVEDFVVMSRPAAIPVPVAPAAPGRPSPFGPRITQPTQPTRPAPRTAAPTPTTIPEPASPFAGGKVVAAGNGNGWKCNDPDLRVWWLYNDDARPMDDGTSGAYRWKTRFGRRWFGVEDRASMGARA